MPEVLPHASPGRVQVSQQEQDSASASIAYPALDLPLSLILLQV